MDYLAGRHDVWCAGFTDHAHRGRGAAEADRALTALRGRCRDLFAVPLRPTVANGRALVSLLTGGTCTEGYFASDRLTRRVSSWSKAVGFDAVLAFSSSMAPLALRVEAERRVLDLDDFDSAKWSALAREAGWPKSRVYETEAKRLRRREREWIAAFDAGVVVNPREAELLDDPALRERLVVIEAGVSVEASSSDAPRAEPGTLDGGLPEGPAVGFVGAMDYGPNVDAVRWFVDSIWPRVREGRPHASFWIVGRSPTRAVRRLHDGVQVHVTGGVPAVEPYLRRFRVVAASVRQARGVQIKVLMAMAAGRPCVVTPPVADGIGALPGRDWMVAGEPATFADRVIELLDDPVRGEAIGAAGRAFVARHHRPIDGLRRLERLLTGKPPEPRVTTQSASADRAACAV